ncbi:unnamed protein product, partial [Meganyctiphanes norvegica]
VSMLVECCCRHCQECSSVVTDTVYLHRKCQNVENVEKTYYNDEVLTYIICQFTVIIASLLLHSHYLSFVRLSALNSSECSEQSSAGGESKQECMWAKCCGLQLDQITHNNILNGHSVTACFFVW